jgi:hypothetical protein
LRLRGLGEAMSKSHRTIWVRVGIVSAFVAAFVVYSFWHTGKSWQFAEVDPEVLYITAVQSPEQGVNACERARCRAMFVLMPHGAAGEPPISDVVNFGFHSKLNVFPIDVEEGDFPNQEQLNTVLSSLKKEKNRPALVISKDGLLSGQVAAVYRLAVLKMPLAEVQKLAALPDAPPETTQAIQEFAARYATALAAVIQPADGRLILPRMAAAPPAEEAGPKPSATAPSLQWAVPAGR